MGLLGKIIGGAVVTAIGTTVVKKIIGEDEIECPHCGEEITEKDDFCPKCGRSVPKHSSKNPIKKLIGGKQFSMKCKGCGAPISGNRGDLKTCDYCGTDNKIT